MKSFGLAMTILGLTATLMALDGSGFGSAATKGLATAGNATGKALSRGSTTASMGQAPEIQNADDDDDEPEPTLFNAFLVTPRPPLPVEASQSAQSASRALRYY